MLFRAFDSWAPGDKIFTIRCFLLIVEILSPGAHDDRTFGQKCWSFTVGGFGRPNLLHGWGGWHACLFFAYPTDDCGGC